MSTFVREHETAQLLKELDAVADVLDAVCECNPDELPYDDVNWALDIVNKAAAFVQRSLEQIKAGAKR
jgi:hypothetical protein